jgi:hypothetical protein
MEKVHFIFWLYGLTYSFLGFLYVFGRTFFPAKEELFRLLLLLICYYSCWFRLLDAFPLLGSIIIIGGFSLKKVCEGEGD